MLIPSCRIRALYADKPRIILLVLLILLIEIAVNSWLLTHGEGEHLFSYWSYQVFKLRSEAVQHGPTVHGTPLLYTGVSDLYVLTQPVTACSMIFDPSLWVSCAQIAVFETDFESFVS